MPDNLLSVARLQSSTATQAEPLWCCGRSWCCGRRPAGFLCQSRCRIPVRLMLCVPSPKRTADWDRATTAARPTDPPRSTPSASHKTVELGLRTRAPQPLAESLPCFHPSFVNASVHCIWTLNTTRAPNPQCKAGQAAPPRASSPALDRVHLCRPSYALAGAKPCLERHSRSCLRPPWSKHGQKAVRSNHILAWSTVALASTVRLCQTMLWRVAA